MTGSRHDRAAEAAAGIRHAVGLAIAFALPVGMGVAAATGLRVAGFPVVGVTLLAVASAVLGSVLAAIRPLPRIRQLGARAVGAVAIAILVRLTIPSLREALPAVRRFEAPLLTGSVVVVTILLLVVHAYGHLFTARVAAVAAGNANLERAQWAEQRVTSATFGAAVVLAIVAAATANATGWFGLLLTLGGVVAGLVLVLDLRDKAPPTPGSRRAAVLAVPRQVRLRSALGALAVTVVLTGLAVPLTPTVDLRVSDRLPGWIENLTIERDRRPAPPGDGRGRHLLGDVPEVDSRVREDGGLIDLPTGPLAALLAAVVFGLLALLRPDRWLETLRRLLALLTGGRLGGLDRDEGDIEAIERAETDRSRGRWRDALDRFRPRPRDPRHAIVHDYLRAERALARAERPRRHDETPLEHAARVGVAEELTTLAALASTARFAPREPSDADADRARTLAQAVERAAGSLEPGAVDPASPAPVPRR
jgi:hypothetical protein